MLCNWYRGHLVHYRSERPVVQNNFAIYVGPKNVKLADRYFTEKREAKAVAILKALGVRYVFVDPRSPGAALEFPDSMTAQLRPKGIGRKLQLAALSHHRLVYEAMRETRWALFVYEIVAGARVEGRAKPGSTVTAKLELVTHPGRLQWVYQAQARADSAGQYTFVLPYGTEPTSLSQARSVGPYTLESGSKSAELLVAEADVREARRLTGPTLD